MVLGSMAYFVQKPMFNACLLYHLVHWRLQMAQRSRFFIPIYTYTLLFSHCIFSASIWNYTLLVDSPACSADSTSALNMECIHLLPGRCAYWSTTHRCMHFCTVSRSALAITQTFETNRHPIIYVHHQLLILSSVEHHMNWNTLISCAQCLRKKKIGFSIAISDFNEKWAAATARDDTAHGSHQGARRNSPIRVPLFVLRVCTPEPTTWTHPHSTRYMCTYGINGISLVEWMNSTQQRRRKKKLKFRRQRHTASLENHSILNEKKNQNHK